MVNDRRLFDGMRAICTVNGNSPVLISVEEVDVTFGGVGLLTRHLRCQEVRNHFLFPKVLCPVQLDDIAKPEV